MSQLEKAHERFFLIFIREGQVCAVANLASMVAKMLTSIAFHAQCSVTAVAEVLLTNLQRRREMYARRRKSKQESGDILKLCFKC